MSYLDLDAGNRKTQIDRGKTQGFRPLLLTDVETRCPNCWIVESSVNYGFDDVSPQQFPDVQLFNHSNVGCAISSKRVARCAPSVHPRESMNQSQVVFWFPHEITQSDVGYDMI